MMLLQQIAKGSLVLMVGALLHIALLFQGGEFLIGLQAKGLGDGWAIPSVMAFLIVLAAHAINVWIWAFVLRWTKALTSMEEAVYFALVTTTTLGYGDIVLPHRWRIFGAMAAVSGLLTFGLSTAFLITVVQSLFENGFT